MYLPDFKKTRPYCDLVLSKRSNLLRLTKLILRDCFAQTLNPRVPGSQLGRLVL